MGFLSKLFGGGEKASKGYDKAKDLYKNLSLPGAEDLFIELDRMVQLGELDPDMAEAILVEQTGITDIEVDPRLREAQYDTLGRLQELSQAEGLDAQAKGKLREARQMEDTRLQGDLAAIEQQAQRQFGASGRSGMEQANKLLAAQQSANRMAGSGFDAAAEAERRALDALAQQAALSGQMESRQFGQDVEKERARDIINQFNVQQQTRTQEQNIANKNRAQEMNLARDYDIQGYNLGQQEAEERAKSAAKQMAAENEKWRAEGMSGALASRGNAAAKEFDAGVKGAGQLIDTAGQIFAMFSDPELKENVKEINVDDFLGDLTGYKYNYKGDDDQMYGVMSDDMKKSNPEMVDDSGRYDKVDYGRALPGMLAALSNINKRLKTMEGK